MWLRCVACPTVDVHGFKTKVIEGLCIKCGLELLGAEDTQDLFLLW